jgi:hypothetical protein
MRDPVCPLVLALYGHPDAGTCWEKHCDGKLREAGFLPIVNWAGCYRHSKLRGVLSVYVDDFKLACHADDEKKIWKLLQGRIKLEDPTMLKQYLGCTHVHHGGDLGKEVKVPGGWLPIPGYKEASKNEAKHKVKGIEYNMSSFIEQCVSAYLELAGLPVTKLSAKAATPFTDETNAFTTEEPEGKLTNIALKVLMKILYAARYCRPDLLRATCALARRVSKWTTECDRRLHRLVSYMHLTVNHKQYAYVGDEFSQCTIALFADADYAGDKTNSWSTSGVFIAIVGPRTYVPIVAVSKKQTCTSHSTCEAEVVAFNTGLKAALPIMDLWEAIMPYFSPAKVGAVSTPKLEAAKIDPGSFAGGVPPDSARLAGADALDSP